MDRWFVKIDAATGHECLRTAASRDLLARPEVDLAVVAVNVTFHRQVATAAIEAGKMVFCEWPLGRNLLEAQEIASLAREKVALSGVLENGALASVEYHAGSSPGPDFVWEINGLDGKLILTAEDGYANIADLTLIGRCGADRLAPLPIPNEYRLAPVGLRGPAVNVAALYGQFAQDIADGTALAPDFEAAVRRHQLIDAIERSEQTGMRVILDDRHGVHRPRRILRADSVETR